MPMPLRRRLGIALAISALVLAPAIVMVVVTLIGTGAVQAAATWASLPAIAGLAAVAAGGRRFAVIVAIVMALLAPLAIVAGLSPVAGAALMALMAMTVGRLSRFGLQRSALLVPVLIAWPLIDPPAWGGQPTVDREDSAYLLWMAAIFLVGGLVPALVGPFLLRKRHLPAPQEHSRGEAVPYTVMVTVLSTVGTFYVLDHPGLYGGAFLIAAIFVLAPIGGAQTLRPTVIRTVATVAGSVFVLAIVSGIESLALVYLVGLVLIVLALMARFGPRGWAYYVLMTPATACLNATSLSQVGSLGEQRVVDNIVGGILVLAASVLAIGYATWATRHGRTDDSDPEAERALAAVGPA